MVDKEKVSVEPPEELSRHKVSSDIKAQNESNLRSLESDKPRTATSETSSLIFRLFWTPPWCRWDPENPIGFSLPLNILFAFAGAFTVANLYYNHPILNILARDFDVSYGEVAKVPTLAQAGYAVGLLLICPLGDLFPRRPYTLILVFFTATLWIGLCVTKSFTVFLTLTFVTAITTVTPQIMLPLVGELAPPARRPLALSIVVSGNLLGIVLARILSGVVTNFTYWRNIYWVALGLQYTIFSLLYMFMPAYPSTNPLPGHGFAKLRAFFVSYPQLLFSILQLTYKYPVLVQAGLISFCTSASFTNYWTTLTFLLSEPPYSLPPTPIGLFGLLGVAGIILGPLYAKYIIQPLKIPLYATFIGEGINLTGCIIGTYTGTFTLAGPIIQALGLDAGLQITQIANRTAIYAVEPTSRNRVNTVFMLFTFMGQITGTAAGNAIFDKYGGWRSSGSLGVAIVAFSFLVCASRGPHEEGWIGWSGGWAKQDNRIKNENQADEQNSAQYDVNTSHDEDVKLESLNGDRPVKSISALSRLQSHGSDGHAITSDHDSR